MLVVRKCRFSFYRSGPKWNMVPGSCAETGATFYLIPDITTLYFTMNLISSLDFESNHSTEYIKPRFLKFLTDSVFSSAKCSKVFGCFWDNIIVQFDYNSTGFDFINWNIQKTSLPNRFLWFLRLSHSSRSRLLFSSFRTSLFSLSLSLGVSNE